MWHDFQKIIPKAAGKYNFAMTLNSIKICQEYRNIAQEILPKSVLDNTFPRTFKNNTLIIGARNSSWAHELHMNKHRIHQSLKKKFGEHAVQKIKIEIAEEHPMDQKNKEN